MSKQTKEFPTADVMSSVTGRLMGDIAGVYEVLGWMTDESLMTHQLPRVGREAKAAMLAFRPDVATAYEEAQHVNPDNWRDWLKVWTDRYGEKMAVPKMTAEQHERIDPVSELVEKVHPDRIVAVRP